MNANKLIVLLIFLAILGLGMIAAGIVLVLRKEKLVLADILMSVGIIVCYFPSKIFLGTFSKLVTLILVVIVLVFAGIAGKNMPNRPRK